MEISLDPAGRPNTITRNHGLPYDIIIAALAHQMHLYNQLWAKQSSATFEER